MGTGLSRR